MRSSLPIFVALQFAIAPAAFAGTLATPGYEPPLFPAEKVPVTCTSCDTLVTHPVVVELAPVSPVPEPETVPAAAAGVFIAWLMARRKFPRK